LVFPPAAQSKILEIVIAFPPYSERVMCRDARVARDPWGYRNGLCDITQEDAPLQEKLRILFHWLADATRQRQWWGCELLLQKRVTLPHFGSTIERHRWCLLATENDLLKEEDMILPINVGLRNDKYIIKE